MTYADTKEWRGKFGRAYQIDVDPEVPLASESVAFWLITAPAYHPSWTQYRLSLIRLREVEGMPSPNFKFHGATHELNVVALNPEQGPWTPERVNRCQCEPMSFLLPVNIAEQFEGDDAEMAELASLCARGVVNGILHPETAGQEAEVRHAWLTTAVRTLAHIRGEEHAP